MRKKSVALCFTFLFVAIITMPSILIAIDDSIDISIFHNLCEEEEEKGKEKRLDIEVLFSLDNLDETDFVNNENENNLEYYFKTYPKPHLNLISPPPEQHIL